jgi:carbohydrate-selective porin OprB
VTYLYQIAPWWSLQPDLQGVFNPGAALSSSLHIPPRHNSLAIGMHTKIDF